MILPPKIRSGVCGAQWRHVVISCHRFPSGPSWTENATKLVFQVVEECVIPQRSSSALMTTNGFYGLLVRPILQKRGPVAHHAPESGSVRQSIVNSGRVRPCAAPRIVFRVFHEPGSHWIEFHMFDCFRHVFIIHGIRGEATLPEMPAPAATEVDPPSVPTMRLAYGLSESIPCARRNDEVGVIRHQTIGQHLHAMTVAPLRH